MTYISGGGEFFLKPGDIENRLGCYLCHTTLGRRPMRFSTPGR